MSKTTTIPVGYAQNIAPHAVETRDPVAYRLVKRGDEYVLQGAFKLWISGRELNPEWRDLPTIVEARDE